jgi:hypothetical protein
MTAVSMTVIRAPPTNTPAGTLLSIQCAALPEPRLDEQPEREQLAERARRRHRHAGVMGAHRESGGCDV